MFAVLFAISDVVWNALIGAGLAIILERMRRGITQSVDTNTKQNAKVAGVQAKNTAEVKDALIVSTATQVQANHDMATTLGQQNKVMEEQGHVLHTVKTLVNSDMRKAIVLIAELARWKAEHSHVPADMEAADAADANLASHDAKQDEVDKSKQDSLDKGLLLKAAQTILAPDVGTLASEKLDPPAPFH